jgi:hypothetical protein
MVLRSIFIFLKMLDFTPSTLARLHKQRPSTGNTLTHSVPLGLGKALVKGEKNGLCNRSACLKPGATFRHIGNGLYYCPECAGLINYPGGQADAQRLFGRPLLCMVDPEDAK